MRLFLSPLKYFFPENQFISKNCRFPTFSSSYSLLLQVGFFLFSQTFIFSIYGYNIDNYYIYIYLKKHNLFFCSSRSENVRQIIFTVRSLNNRLFDLHLYTSINVEIPEFMHTYINIGILQRNPFAFMHLYMGTF